MKNNMESEFALIMKNLDQTSNNISQDREIIISVILNTGKRGGLP